MQFKPILGTIIGKHYKILRFWDMAFSVVIELWDRITRSYMACKVINSGHFNNLMAMKEYEILNKIKDADPNDKIPIIKVYTLDLKLAKDHLCILMPKTGISLHKWIKYYGKLPLNVISSIAKQLLDILEFIHSKMKIIHTDIKTRKYCI